MNINIDPSVLSIYKSDLDVSQASSDESKFVLVIPTTVHHETGERAYLLGCSPREEVPEATLVNTGELIIALYMSEEEMSRFDNSLLTWQDGYVVLKNQRIE